jgi:haloacetate dehalogenase
MFEGFERKVVLADGLDIACAVGGKGAPILLLHGFPQTMAMWARVAPQLANEFTVVCADPRGYGASTKPEMPAGPLRLFVSRYGTRSARPHAPAWF